MLQAEMVLDGGAGLADAATAPAASATSSQDARAKRCFDVAVAGLLLIVLAPLLLCIAGLIRLTSPGPALFRQRRLGRGQVCFRMAKFRTMHVRDEDEFCRVQTARGDPRVTAIGGFLRRTSLDELPQLMNVLTGHMSIVGPRPHALGTRAGGLPLEDAEPRYWQRYGVRPGITGLAQVNGCRGALDSAEKLRRRVAFDLAYIETSSLAVDLRIIARTVRKILFDRDAY